MGSDAKVKDGEARAGALIREALALLEAAGASAATFHVRLAITALERRSLPCGEDGPVRGGLQGDAFAHAIGVMAGIVEYIAQRDGPRCVDAIAQAMEDHGREIAHEHMGAALLLDHWAGIVREQRGSVELPGRRDN